MTLMTQRGRDPSLDSVHVIGQELLAVSTLHHYRCHLLLLYLLLHWTRPSVYLISKVDVVVNA